MNSYRKIRLSPDKVRDEHRLVVEWSLGRSLRSDELVHHKDGDKANNSLDNLEVVSRADHARLHVTRDQVERMKALAAAQKKPLVHGTVNGYRKKRCRCDECRAANAKDRAEYRNKYGKR